VGSRRPDGLIEQLQVSLCDINNSPIRNDTFDAGSTSRINIVDFMSKLAINSAVWNEWKGQVSAIYNQV
jgi:hypothetical protein